MVWTHGLRVRRRNPKAHVLEREINRDVVLVWWDELSTFTPEMWGKLGRRQP